MLRLHAKSHVKRLLKRIEPKLYHKWLKARLIKRAISDPSKPVYWESFKSEYVEVNTISGEMLMEGKRLAKAFHTLWQQLNEKY